MNESVQKLLALSSIDLGIIVAYFVLVVVAGAWFSRKASAGLSEYFLGGRSIPWWIIGASGTASNLDMTGTMVIVSFFFTLGLQGFWVSLRGGAALPLGMLMIFMGAWLQRSKVMTTAEWMTVRFGDGAGGQSARMLSAVSNLIVTLGFTVYFCKGTGKFLAVFLGWDPALGAALMVGIGVAYTMSSGLYGVIYTDLIQEVLLIITAIAVSYYAFTMPDQREVLAQAGESWLQLKPNWILETDGWLEKAAGGYRMFGACMIMWTLRGVLEGAGGFTGGYMPQRYYAVATERQAGLLTAEWIVLLMLRWTMIIGLAVLGLKISQTVPQLAAVLMADPETTLPVVLGHVLPTGVKGMAVAGLIAAAMSTFDSTINAGAAYWVKDIYQWKIRPDASEKVLMRQSYLATFILAVAALAFALAIKNIDDIWGWITGPLSAGLFAPIVLRWWWWRFNGQGFAIATAVGLLAAIVVKAGFSEWPLFVSFPVTTLVSLVGGVVGSLATQPTEQKVLKAFYLRVKPFGLWEPVRRALRDDPDAAVTLNEAKGESRRALLNAPATMVLQLTLFLLSMHVVLRLWTRVSVLALLAGGLTLMLYFSWYRKLPLDPPRS